MLWPTRARAEFDPFADDRALARFVIAGPDGMRLVLKGAAELSWLNLEGAGGLGRESATDTLSIGTRSGHIQLDRIRLAPRLLTADGLALLSELSFDATRARARAVWLYGRWQLHPTLDIHAELGLARPFVATDPLTRRMPLGARIWWNSSEAHATTVLGWNSGDWRIEAGASVALTRPLGAAPVNDASRQGTIALLVHDTHRPLSGGTPTYGGRLAAAHRWARVDVFGFHGTLANDGGTDALRNRLEGFRRLPGFNAVDPQRQSTALWWAGTRLDISPGPFLMRFEGVTGRESLVRRSTLLAQASLTGGLCRGVWLPGGTLILRAERYRIHTDALRVAAPSQALSWDWDALTLAGRLRLYRRLLWLRIEHSWLRERRGGPRFPNDETTAQLELRY